MKQLDPISQISINLANSPGAYVLVAGSGFSRSSGIPTGWEITLDLITQFALARDGKAPADPQEWYQSEFKDAPKYSEVIETIAPSIALRQSALRKYFEPTKTEREQGKKVPSPAHNATANLVQDGTIRVIITTNFDRLFELALEGVGITPVVISTPDSLLGAPSFHLNKCTIIKVNGDYLDLRIKNSESELLEFDPTLDKHLERIFSDHGLIFCGWSATWDIALRKVVERSHTKKYFHYWIAPHDLSEEGNSLASLLGAKIIKSEANDFFEALSTKTRLLNNSLEQHPYSIEQAVAEVKMLLPKADSKIALADFVEKLATQTLSSLDIDKPDTREKFSEKLEAYDQALKLIRAVTVCAAEWCEPSNYAVWIRMFDRIANSNHPYAALSLGYAFLLTAILNDRYELAIEVLGKIKVHRRDKEMKLFTYVYASSFSDSFNRSENSKWFTPVSDHLFTLFKTELLSYAVNENRLKQAFWQTEFLWGVLHAEEVGDNGGGVTAEYWGPPGRFTWEAMAHLRDVKKSQASIFGEKYQQVIQRLLKVGFAKKSDFHADTVADGYTEVQTKIASRWN